MIIKAGGIRNAPTMKAALNLDADLIEFTFHPRARRNIDVVTVMALLSLVPEGPQTVGMFIDPSEDDLDAVLSTAPLDMIHLAGHETPERVAALKAVAGIPVIKSFRLARRADTDRLAAYAGIIDYAQIAGLPGANILSVTPDDMDSFALPAGILDALADGSLTLPMEWFLAGSLTADAAKTEYPQKIKRIAVSLS